MDVERERAAEFGRLEHRLPQASDWYLWDRRWANRRGMVREDHNADGGAVGFTCRRMLPGSVPTDGVAGQGR